MPVIVHVPTPLRVFTEGRDRVLLDGAPATVGEALDRLFRAHPGVRDRVMTETGEVRRHVNVFVDDENVRFLAGLATPLADGARVHIFPAVSGG
ncbi:MoaD family protein [bacterium]|nr:MoaD family protein [bacterium]